MFFIFFEIIFLHFNISIKNIQKFLRVIVALKFEMLPTSQDRFAIKPLPMSVRVHNEISTN